MWTVFKDFTECVNNIVSVLDFSRGQWLRTCLPMQGTWIRSLVREIPHATKPTVHNPRPTHLEPVLPNRRRPHAAMKTHPVQPKMDKQIQF